MSDSPTQELLFLYELEELLKSRKEEMPKGSYTTSLFQEGVEKVIQKVGEEAVEVLIASMSDQEEEIIYETADLIYHLTVLLVQKGIPLDRIAAELKSRSR
ncbi:MAG: phosphoribosyl-ATP diphosphatase [Balneolaceae bacterium]